MQLSNDPFRETPVFLKQHRPFSLAVQFVKDDGKTPVDLTDSELRMVIAAPRHKGGTVQVTSSATLVDAPLGLARFDVQGSDLGFAPGTYDLAVTLTTAEGFETSIIEGNAEMAYNPDPVVPADYVTVAPPLGLTVRLQSQNRVVVKVHHVPDAILAQLTQSALDAAGAATLAATQAAAAAAASDSQLSTSAALAAQAAAQAAAADAAAAEAAAQAALALANEQATEQQAADATAAAQAAAQAAADAAAAAQAAAASAASAGSASEVTAVANAAQADADAALAAAAQAQATADQIIADYAATIQSFGKDMFVNQKEHTDAVHVHAIQVLTQAAYDALGGSTISDCLYVIRG